MSSLKIANSHETENILKGFLNTTLKEIMSVLETESGSLFLFDGDHKELVLDSLYNSGDLHLKGLRQRIGEGISGKVVNIKMPVLVKDIACDTRFKRNGFRHYRTSSFISIPLFSSKGPMGVINLTDKSNGRPFTEKDLDIAALICRYACLAVDNLVEYLELRTQKDTLDKQKAALEKYASVGKLAAGVVHEVNNPLDGMLRYANILLNEMEHSSPVREYLLEVKRGLDRITNITKSLLVFSHQVNSSSLQNKKYVDIHNLIDETLDVLSERINGRIRVNKRFAFGLSKVRDLGLAHLLTNIIKNALEAMPQTGTLEISTNKRDSRLEISFKDTGIGIPNNIKGQIFEPFFTTKDIDRGTGLGLAICNEIINKYEGKIEVESSEGKGSKFTVLIPSKYLENA